MAYAATISLPSGLHCSQDASDIVCGQEKTLEQCRSECLGHPECVGIEFCGPELGGKHACDSNECILLSSTLDSNKAAGWAIFQVRRQHIRTCEQRCADCPCLLAQHVPAGSMGGGH